MWTENGILAGDPQAPLAAKIYLQKALKAFCKKIPFLHVDLWIADLSFDVVNRDVENAVRIAIQAYHYIKELLEEDNLKLSVKKTGFITSNVQAKRLLQRQLPSNGPAVHDVMKDLGVDCTAGRLRRIQTMRARRTKASKKTKKLHTLNIPMRAVRLKLYKGSIQSGISWGHQALGMAPQTRNRIRTAMARQMGLQRTGNADIVFDMQPRHKDPDFEAFAAQVKIYRQCFGNWPEHLHRDLDRAWQVTKDRLKQAKHPWQVVKGPVAALQCYLNDRGWDTTHYDRWTKQGANGEEDFRAQHACIMALHVKEELQRAQVRERITNIQKRTMLQEVQQPLDWTPWKRLASQSNPRTKLALQTWRQGSHLHQGWQKAVNKPSPDLPTLQPTKPQPFTSFGCASRRTKIAARSHQKTKRSWNRASTWSFGHKDFCSFQPSKYPQEVRPSRPGDHLWSLMQSNSKATKP